MEFLAKIKGYRTLIVQGVAIVVAALTALGAIPVAQFAGITPETVGVQFDTFSGAIDAAVASVVALMALISAALRFLTKGPVGSK
jgi:Mg2+/Co2+ transporter CorB